MNDDLRDRLADALAYRPASSAYDYADRVLPLVREEAAAAYRRGHKLGELNMRDALDRANALIRKLSREAMTAELAVERVRELTDTWEAKGLVPMGHYATRAVRAALDGPA